ncbi:MAG: hypothetical protein IT372_04005 [Polyangiaceae bacterium]|nr:hypothetical protein [Polyangiaceae bacterium]
MRLPPVVEKAAEALCARFEQGEYNPTPIIDLGALVASADGTVDAQEIDTLRQIVGPMLRARLDGELIGYLIEASAQVIRAAGVEPRVRLLAEILLDCDAVEEGVLVALGVAFASEGLSDPERAVIASLARSARLPDGRLEALITDVRRASEASPPD